ncbi:hypothetical protein CDCA_CDCA04G1182 [Cyanidium caldarium]|uniref:Non-specific serine/threonine protein kinase n=1 Tax=Cyanidium caldarium TaxID=2771 RepID=A0AAV9IS76_CYACA|nr:hypothetical protein CDCA_CDCA04G1182 [Cyanidium caldarium]
MQAGRRRERDPAGVPVTGALLELAAAGDALECYAGPRVLQRLRDEAGLAVEITDDGSRYVLRDGRTVQHLRQALWACANVVEEAVGVDVDGGSGERSLAAVVESAWGSCRATLLRALQPIMRALPEESAGGAAAAAGTYESIGVSLAQVLLTLPDAGDAVARCLVQRAAELDQDISHREPITGVVTAFGADAAEQRLSSLCVEQLRWLQATLRCLRNDAEVAVAETRVPVTTPEPSALIDCLLSVLSIASSQLQLSIIETLPEVAASAEDMDAEEARIGDALVPLWDDCLGEGNGHRRIPLAVLDAVATFRSAAAGRRAQRQLVERALALLPSMPPGAEAALSIRFLLGSMAEASATPNAVDASASPPGELGKGLQGIRIFLAVRDSLADSGAASADARLVFEAVLVTLQRSRRVATAVMNWYAAAQRCDMRAAPDPDDCSDVWRVIAGEPSLADVWFALAIFIAHPDLLQKRPGGMSWMRRGAAAVNARTVIGWLLLRGNVLQRFLVDASEWFDESFGAAILRLFHCCCQDAAALAGAERPQRVSQVAHTWQWLLLQLPRHRPECLLNALDAVSSGDAWQRAMALQTLCLVAEEEPRALHPFLPLMYGLLDYVEVLAPPQFGDIVTSSTDSAKRARPSSAAAVDEQPLRLLFRVLGALHAHAVCVAASRRHGQEVALPCSDGTLDNLLQKELRHHDVVYQRIGCVAAAALVERCAQSTATVHRALELLELALRCTEQRPQVAARLYDELSQVALVPMRGGAAANTASVASASRWQVSEFLFQQCVCHLSRLFLTTTTTTTTPPWSRAEEGARVRRQYGLSAGDTAFVVRIDALAVTGTATDREWLALLCPLCRLAFHALPSDEQRQQRFRDELLPLLRCAVELPAVLFQPFHEQELNGTTDATTGPVVLLAALCARNWFRELVRSAALLSPPPDEELLPLLHQRLAHALEMERLAQQWASRLPDGSALMESFPSRALGAECVRSLLQMEDAQWSSPELCLLLREVHGADSDVTEMLCELVQQVAEAAWRCRDAAVVAAALPCLERAPSVDRAFVLQQLLPPLSAEEHLMESASLVLSALRLLQRVAPVTAAEFAHVQAFCAQVLHAWQATDRRILVQALDALFGLAPTAADALQLMGSFVGLPDGSSSSAASASLEWPMIATTSSPLLLRTLYRHLSGWFARWCAEAYAHRSAGGNHVGRQLDGTVRDEATFQRMSLHFIETLRVCTDEAVARRDRATLACAMRHGRVFIEAVVQHLIPVWVAHYENWQAYIAQACARLQKSTRLYQRLCAYAKGQRQGALAIQTPGLKKALESFLYRVKGMLQANSCLSSFWVGNLRHKDLEGQVVGSQLMDEAPPGERSPLRECPQNFHGGEGEVTENI